jgi:hypothetical protein
MAFTGVAAFQLLADNQCRITGLSLAGGAAGTISLAGGSGQVVLPAEFHAAQYTGPVAGVIVPTQASIDVKTADADTTTPKGASIRIVKTGQSTTDFLATLTNMNTGSVSPALEIYLKFHD